MRLFVLTRYLLWINFILLCFDDGCGIDFLMRCGGSSDINGSTFASTCRIGVSAVHVEIILNQNTVRLHWRRGVLAVVNSFQLLYNLLYFKVENVLQFHQVNHEFATLDVDTQLACDVLVVVSFELMWRRSALRSDKVCADDSAARWPDGILLRYVSVLLLLLIMNEMRLPI